MLKKKKNKNFMLEEKSQEDKKVSYSHEETCIYVSLWFFERREKLRGKTNCKVELLWNIFAWAS